VKFEGITIKDLTPGGVYNGIYILRSKELKKASNNKEFIDLVFLDQTGSVQGKIWDADKTKFEALQVDLLYYVNFQADEWKGNIQLNINKIKLAEASDQDEIYKFVPSSPIKPEVMYDSIFKYAESIENSEIKVLTTEMLQRNKEKLMYYPAAKSLHHAIRSGLLYHILRMLQLAEKLMLVYENVNKDLLFAGVILHDLEKLNELEANNLGFAEYTKEGQLLGHLVMGVRNIDKLGRELGISEEVLLLIEHMIISHHYEAEYGSPKKPMFLEAELLHYIDLIDARVYDYNNAVSNLNTGEFSEPIWSLDKRRVLKHGI